MRVAVGLSGGVDSSVAAALLKEQGHDVVGITMDIWSGEDSAIARGHGCYGPGKGEVAKARAVAESLGVEFHVLDLREEYRSIVLEYFKSEYKAGRTPNPCLRCNPRVKFGAMLEKARESGIVFDRFATGHYARVDFDAASGRFRLLKALDGKKDQSYGLIFLGQEQLSRTLFPLGGICKKEVRAIARKLGLASKDERESQDFYSGEISDLIGAEPNPGYIVDSEGRALGRHSGLWNYTIGQRRGLGIPGGKPLYVKSMDLASNTVIVDRKPGIYSIGLVASHINPVSVETLIDQRAQFRIRHTQEMIDGTMEMLPRGELRVTFDTPQWAVAPGQAVGVYQGDVVLAGGTIETGIPAPNR